MPERTIPTGATEPITATVLDVNGDPLTGKTDIKVKVRRQSNDQWLDWADMTFKAGGSVTQLLQVMAEVSATFSPGDYELDFDTSALANPAADDIYHFTVEQDVGTDADNLPLKGELEVGTWRDQLDRQNLMVMQSYSYDPGTDTLEGQIWVEQDGAFLTPSAVSVSWYKDGVFLFSVAATGPDAQGFFKMVKVNPGLATNDLYSAIPSVTLPVFGIVKGGMAPFTVG